MSISGMNTESIRNVAHRLSQQSDQMNQIARAVDSLLRVAAQHWQGDDLHQFDTVWSGQYRATCLGLAAQLGDLSTIASANVQAQEQTSATLDGGAGGFGAGVGIGAWDAGSSSIGGLLGPAAQGAGWDGLGLFKSGMDLLDSINNMELLHGVDWKDLENAATGSVLISSLGFLPDAYEAFTTAAQGNLTPEGLLDFSGKTYELGGTLLDKYATTLDGAAMGMAMQKTAGVIGVAMDMGHAYQDFEKGDVWAGTYDSVHAVVGAVGVAYPPVGLCLGAWDAGVATGTWIANSPPMQQMQDNAVAYGAAHDADIATRYDVGQRGIEAVGNYFSDTFHGIFG